MSRISVSAASLVANDRARLTVAAPRPLQFFDVKEANDRTAATREKLRLHLRRARGPVTLENLFLRRHIADLWRAYRVQTAHSQKMTALYMAQIRAQGFTRFSLASSHTGKPTREAA